MQDARKQKLLVDDADLCKRIQPPVTTKITHGSQHTGKVEWYTPKQYIDSARLVMGSIDLDPASCKFANEVVQAPVFFDIDSNGLSKDWFGNVWMNPPYANKLITSFTDKLIGSIAERKVNQAVLLTHNLCDSAWFHKVSRASCRFCITRGRIRHYGTDGELGTPTHGHAFFYFCSEHVESRADKFEEEFSRFGFVAKVVK